MFGDYKKAIEILWRMRFETLPGSKASKTLGDAIDALYSAWELEVIEFETQRRVDGQMQPIYFTDDEVIN